MSNLKNWLDTIEQLKEKQKPPFKKHQAVETLNEHEKNSYAVLHAAFILFNGSITQNQERLYSFWLPSISNELKLSEIINQAQEFDSEKLKESITLIESKELFEFILLDVLVFSRIEGVLSEDLKQILNEWCQLLKIEQKVITDVVAISDLILGTNDPQQPILSSTVAKLISNPVWSEFYIQELNKNNINKVNGGMWRIEKDILDITEEVSITNALIVFYKNTKISIFGNNLNLSNVGLINPQLDLIGVTLTMDNIIAKGAYNTEHKLTIFNTHNIEVVKITNSYFELKNARAFTFIQQTTDGSFDNVEFQMCGNPYLLGGAVNYQQDLKFTNCHFEDCNAKVAGAVFLKYLTEKSFENCKFIRCSSEHEWQEGINAGSLYCGNEINRNNIIDCFIDNNISVFELNSDSDWDCEETRMLSNSIIKGMINYYTSLDGASLDPASIIKCCVTNTDSKNKKTPVTTWDALVQEEAAEYV